MRLVPYSRDRAHILEKAYNNEWVAACDFQQFGTLTSVDSDEPVQPPF